MGSAEQPTPVIPVSVRNDTVGTDPCVCPQNRPVCLSAKQTRFFREIEAQIMEIFDLTRDAYRDVDIEKAQRAMDMHWEISERCDKMFENLASEEGLSAEYAVIYTLLSRYLKRVSSHLKNIASSVVNPFPRMGFRSSAEGKDLDVG